MRPGDWIYIPRGFYHKAETADKHSLHAAVSVNTHTWMDACNRLINEIPEFRQSLPVGVLDINNKEEWEKNYLQRVNSLLQKKNEFMQILNSLF